MSPTIRETKLAKLLIFFFLERNMGITGVPFGRTELSLRLSRTEFCALLRREVPEGSGVQGMPEKTFS